MSEVWKEAYEVVGSGVQVAKDFFDRVSAAQDRQWEFAKSYGASGLRPDRSGGIRSLLFKKMPENFRKIGTEQGLIECVPHKGSKAGKEIYADFNAVERAPTERELLDYFGWNGRSPMWNGRIYFGSVTKLVLPSVRYLIRLPRQIGDGFVASPELKLIPMAEYLQAFEDHNAVVRKSKRKAA